MILSLLRVVVAVGVFIGERLRHRQHSAQQAQSATGAVEPAVNSTMLIGGLSIVMVCRKCWTSSILLKPTIVELLRIGLRTDCWELRFKKHCVAVLGISSCWKPFSGVVGRRFRWNVRQVWAMGTLAASFKRRQVLERESGCHQSKARISRHRWIRGAFVRRFFQTVCSPEAQF